MIDKKMKGVYDGTSLPIGVAATAAVGQTQARGHDKKTRVDISQHSNLTMNLENLEAAVTKYSGLLQELSQREEAAKKMLALGDDAPQDERRRAEALLLKCQEERTNLEEASERRGQQIAQIKAQLAPMLSEVERQQKIRSVAAGLR
jgi:uncharacterized protein (DUF342 family)